MNLSEFDMIMGCDIAVAPGITIRQPTIGAIKSIPSESPAYVGGALSRFEKYNSFLNILLLRPEDVLKPEVFKTLPDEVRQNIDTYSLLLVDETCSRLLLEALSFFIVENVSFDTDTLSFKTDSGGVINADNFNLVREVILKTCCCYSDDVVKPKFGGAKAKAIFEKIAKGREAMAKAKVKGDKLAYMLPNVLSSLSAKHPSINLITALDYTVYQIYDQFNRTCVNAQIGIIGQRWAAWGKEDFDFTSWYQPINTKTSS